MPGSSLQARIVAQIVQRREVRPTGSRARRGVASRGDEQSRDAPRAVPLFLKLAMLDESAAVLRKQARRHSLVRRLSFVQLRRLAGYMWRACFPREARQPVAASVGAPNAKAGPAGELPRGCLAAGVAAELAVT